METKGATFCCSLPRVRRREEVARGGGSLEQGGGAWNDSGHASEARWRRVALGWLREREGEEGEQPEREGRARGGLVRVSWRLEKGRGREEASREVATAIARASTRLCLLAEVEDSRFA